ncbi:MAG: hypothetical protein J0I84_21060 [Terrimonas sp.]|nr:hypothetical protein [Terrimonas sp.]OJY84621.1 MAG: hypothetical protein BGP13_21780 [Sphingobacteriales bacterium 40-81]
MKKMIPAILAFVIAVSAVAFTTEKKRVPNPGNFTEYFYKFTGSTTSDVSDMSKWQQISQNGYDSILCNSTAKACKIINTTNSGGHPTSVPAVAGVPQETGVNVEVRNLP